MKNIYPISGLYVTHESDLEAEKIIAVLLEKKLIACANVFPIQSYYSWKNKVKKETEVVSLLKTRPENLEKCIRIIKDIHPYETPCILQYQVEANEEYYHWLRQSTTPENSG